MIDYAYPTMMAEKALKDLHDAVLSRDYTAAQNRAQEAVKWVMTASAAIEVQKLTEQAIEDARA